MHQANPGGVTQGPERLQYHVVRHRPAAVDQSGGALGVGGDEHAPGAVEAGGQHGGHALAVELAHLQAGRSWEVADEHGQPGHGVHTTTGTRLPGADGLLYTLVTSGLAHSATSPEP